MAEAAAIITLARYYAKRDTKAQSESPRAEAALHE
jgi:hypothetical protein